MSGIYDGNATDSNDNALIGVMGGTDNTRIGNVGDKLKVDASITYPNGRVASWNKYLRYYDMNAANGGVARGSSITTTFTNIFNYSGAGFFIGMRLSLEDKNNWFLRIIVDGEDILIGNSGIDISDMSTKALYGWEWADTADESSLGLDCNDETICVQSPLSFPIYFATSLVIQIKHRSGAKKFRAGLIALQRDI